MKRITWIILFFFVLIEAEAQNQNNSIYQLYQLTNTEDSVKSFLVNTNIKFRSDTLYMILLPPGGCPRCEGLISPIADHLKSLGKYDIALLAIYPKRNAVIKYLERMKFNINYQVTNNGSFIEYFNISSDNFIVPFLAKFNVKTGELINSQSLLGFHADSAHVAEFVKSNEALPKRDPESLGISIKRTDKDMGSSSLRIHRAFLLKEDTEYPLSTNYNLSLDSSNAHLMFTDYLTNYIYVYKLNDAEGRLLTVLKPGETEERYFVNIPEKDFQYMKSINLIRTMFFTSYFISDSSVMISASLPKITMDVKNDSTISYYNEACCVIKNIHTNAVQQVISFEPLPESNFFISHTEAIYNPLNKLLFVPVKKGWPVKGTQMLNASDTINNPFISRFYDHAPAVAIFDSSGKFLKYFDRLPWIFEQLKTGYYASSPKVRVYNGKIYTGDPSSGTIYRYADIGKSAPEDSIRLIRHNIKQSDVDREKEPLNYIIDVCEQNLSVRLKDFNFHGKDLYALLKNGNGTYKIVRLSAESKKVIDESVIPDTYKGAKLKEVKLLPVDKRMYIVSTYENENTYFVEYEMK